MQAGSLWERAKAAAERTPETRNRAIDFYRAVSIGAVVLGHWLLAAPQVLAGGGVRFGDLFHVAPWTIWLTWAFQMMPIFFMVGALDSAAAAAGSQPALGPTWFLLCSGFGLLAPIGIADDSAIGLRLPVGLVILGSALVLHGPRPISAPSRLAR
ncbi:MAG: hypothetical protein K0S81_3975 [Rhodospirillales bacterium]|nr:hypothetical protein [Rhodospirillales bacterium]